MFGLIGGKLGVDLGLDGHGVRQRGLGDGTALGGRIVLLGALGKEIVLPHILLLLGGEHAGVDQVLSPPVGGVNRAAAHEVAVADVAVAGDVVLQLRVDVVPLPVHHHHRPVVVDQRPLRRIGDAGDVLGLQPRRAVEQGEGRGVVLAHADMVEQHA